MRRLFPVILALTLAASLSSCRTSSSQSESTRTTAPVTTASAPPTTPTTALGPGRVAPCGTPTPSGQTSESFDFQGTPRTYQLYIPPSYNGHPVPLVFDFHGFGSSAVQQMLYGSFAAQADRDDFVIVAPDGQGATRHFNLTGEAGLQDDVAMVGALLDHIQASFCVDAKRVFATGMSDGGAMTSALACHLPDRFAAFGAVAVIVFQAGCAGTKPVSITAFSGTADPVVPFDGGAVHCCGNPTLGSAPDAMAGWAHHDGCAAAFVEDRLGSEVRRRTWTGCRDNASVVFYIIDGGGHTWPGSIPLPGLGLTTEQINASDTIWDFFKAHPLAA